MASQTTTIDSDAGPLLLLLELVKRSPQLFVDRLDMDNLPCEFARAKTDYDPADTSKILVRLYPTDGFLRHLSACAARDGEGNFVE